MINIIFIGLAIAGALMVIAVIIDLYGGWDYIMENVFHRPSLVDDDSVIPASRKYVQYVKDPKTGDTFRYNGKRKTDGEKYMVLDPKGTNKLESHSGEWRLHPASVNAVQEGNFNSLYWELDNDSAYVRYEAEIKSLKDRIASLINEKAKLIQDHDKVRIDRAKADSIVIGERTKNNPFKTYKERPKTNVNRDNDEEDSQEKMAINGL